MIYSCNPYDEKNFEKNIIDAFAKYYQGGSTYIFDCRPDEMCHTPAPDFKFINKATKNILYIELTRITSQNLEYERAVHETFKPLGENLTGKIKGSYILIIKLEDIPKITKKKRRDKLIATLEQEILKISTSMNENNKFELQSGIILLKYTNEGSDILPFVSDIMSPLASKDKSYLINLFIETGTKFKDFRNNNSTNLLVILHSRRIYPWSEIGHLIKDIKAGLYGKQIFPSDMIDGIYDVILDLEWQQDITISECYPNLKSEGMGPKSQICDNQRDYTNACLKYFQGL
jgi:hypothetical protein